MSEIAQLLAVGCFAAGAFALVAAFIRTVRARARGDAEQDALRAEADARLFSNATLMADVEALVIEAAGRYRDQASRLEELIARADQRITRLRETAAAPRPDAHEAARAMAAQGAPDVDIALRTGLTVAEVQVLKGRQLSR